LYNALGGSQDPDTEKHTDGDDHNYNTKRHLTFQLSLNVRAVRINRPWLNLNALSLQNFKIPGDGIWSTGELSSKNKGSFSLLSTQMIVAKDLNVTVKKDSQTKVTKNGPLNVSLYGCILVCNSFKI